MGITLGELQARLYGELDVIPAASTRERINDALREIYDDREWGFLLTDGFIRTPKLIQGSAQVAKFSDSVILDAEIISEIQAINEFDIDIVQRQFRVINSKEVDRGFIYNIIDIDFGTNTIKIDPPYQDVDDLAAKVQILKIFYKPPYYNPPYEKEVDPVPDPIIDFKRFEFVISPQFNRRLIIDGTTEELNKIDPYREYCSEPRYLIPASFNSYEEPMFEMYPAPRFARVFRVKYLRAGLPLVKDTDKVSDIFTRDLIVTKAKIKSYEWAKANADKLKLKVVGRFDNLIAMAENKYNKLLEDAIKRDEERFPRAYLGNVLDSCPEYPREFEHYHETLILNF